LPFLQSSFFFVNCQKKLKKKDRRKKKKKKMESRLSYQSERNVFDDIRNACVVLELNVKETPSGFICGGTRETAAEIEINVFKRETGFRVEFRRYAGCRFAFAEIADELASAMNVQFHGGKAVGLRRHPSWIGGAV